MTASAPQQTEQPDRRDPLSRGAVWITAAAWQADPAGPLPIVGTDFRCPGQPTSAVLRVAGLGVFTASINGCPVSADLLEPGYADYAQRVDYCSYDVTHLISAGDNVLVIEIGPGMYRSQRLDDRWTKIKSNYGELAACAVLTLKYGDGNVEDVISGTDWGGTLGQTSSSNWTGGEDFDARVPLDTSVDGVPDWPRAVVARTPPSSG